MNKSYLVVGAVVLLLLLGGAAFAFKSQIKSLLTGGQTQQAAPVYQVPATPAPSPTPTATAAPTQQQATVEVDFDGSKFSPNPLTVKVGTTVKFVSVNGDPMWVASTPHPTHTDLPGFDQLSSGAAYSYTFTKVGTWGFHDHLQPSIKGSVIVTP